jgi:pyridoxal phosphate enzyme (YggS family)
MTDISANLEALRQKIAAAAKVAGRDPAGVKLVAVSKFQPVEAVRAALAAGQTCFGENRVQEARAKYEGLRDEYPALELHLIGPLQTNKAAEAVRLFDVIETLDRPKLAAALAAAMKKERCSARLYVEVNTGNEPQKSGVAPEALGDFLRLCREEYGLSIKGLMCIPPEADDAAPHFQLLKRLADENGLPYVSMGMSADYESAIRCGATEIRVGTAVFGERKTI